ncbi:hypothetical protein [Halomontanus rarus]|uniref:hypothetical protein n=1 Tax=Halomontanus rarus TaxID=3034020 RepID=UPI001A98711F
MSDGEPLPPDELLESAADRLESDDLTLAENEAILRSISELTPVFEHDRSYFVLGSYDRGPIRRLALVTDRLNRRTDAYAFRMVDVRGEWSNGIQKFCLIADLVSFVVGVAEREPSDFLVEQGLLVGTEEYFSKSHVLKREYDDDDDDEGDGGDFGWMQEGVFGLIEREGRLYRWNTEDDLVGAVAELP